MIRHSKNRKPEKVLVTVHGFLQSIQPAVGKNGCVLHVTDGRSTGRYHVPLSINDCCSTFQEGSVISFRLESDASPDRDGVYRTAGTHAALWQTT